MTASAATLFPSVGQRRGLTFIIGSYQKLRYVALAMWPAQAPLFHSRAAVVNYCFAHERIHSLGSVEQPQHAAAEWMRFPTGSSANVS